MMRSENLRRNLIFSLFLFLCATSLLFPSLSSAQGYGMGGMGMGRGYGMGMNYGMGMGMGGIDQGPGLVTVKYGEKIYDAVFGDLIDYNVQYIQVRADSIGVDYFDDGTHGDEVAYDGMPSLIYINRDTYLGPFSIKYKNVLENMLENAEEMGPLMFYNLNVASNNPESRVENISTREEQMQSEALGLLRTQLAQFEGYDAETYRKAIDPTLFESLEGFGGGGFGGGGGPAGYFPNLPPPPGIPRQDQSQQQQQQPGMQGQPPEGSMTQEEDGQPYSPVNRALEAQEAMNELP